MKDLYNKYKREIWVGVVVSLITTAILKFGDWVLDVVPLIGVTIFETISNVLYSLAATHTDNLLLRIIILSSLGLLVGMMAKPICDDMKIYVEVLRLEKKAKKMTIEDIQKIEKEMQEERSSKTKKSEPKGFFEMIKDGKKVGKSAIKIVLLIALAYLLIAFFLTGPMELSNDFQQDIVKIAPYVDAEEVTRLRSDWVCMRSKSDYDEIYVVIDQVVEENALPK